MARETRSPSRVSRISRPKRRRGRWSMEFKLAVVKAALQKPEDARIKPTCRDFPGVAPVQVRRRPSARPNLPTYHRRRAARAPKTTRHHVIGAPELVITGPIPSQVRKWIRLFAPEAATNALPTPDESEDETSDVEASDTSFNYKQSDDSYPSAEQSAAEALMCLPGLMR